MHSDEQLDRLGAEAKRRWVALGGSEAGIELAVEGSGYELPAHAASAATAS
jgi:hypothetical protein